MLKIIRALGALFLSLLAVILIVYAFALFQTKIRLKNYPELFNYKFYLVKADTNLNDINVDDLIIIKEDDTFNMGDIVLYLSNDNLYILSRVVSKNSVSVELKQDSLDGKITTNNSVVVGKAVKKIRDAGKIIHIVTNKVFLALLAVLGFILVVFAQEKLNKPKQIT